MRGAFILFTIFTIAVSGILFWQWETYIDEKSLAEKDSLQEASQKIIVEADSKELKVTQIFNNLKPKKEYRVLLPEGMKEWSCVDESDGPCASKDKDPETFLADHERIQVHFKLPIKQHKSFIYLRNWTVQLHEIDIKETSLQIIDTAKIKGTWVSGLPHKAYKNMEYIDYYVFEGLGSEAGIYWQSPPLFKHELTEGITLYTESSKPEIPKISKKNAKFSEDGFLALIQTSRTLNSSPDGMFFVKQVPNESSIAKLAASNHIRSFLNIEVEQPFFIDMLSSLLLGEQAQTPKGKYMLSEISSQLNQDQINNFMEEISTGENWNAAGLDEALGKIKESKTNFFKENKALPEKRMPLYFFDKRKVRLNGETTNHLQIIYEDNRALFPFKETMSGLGFKVKELPEVKAVELDNGINKYRFYLNRKIFNHNQAQYGLLEVPLFMRNGTIYIEQKGLQALFDVTFKENQKEITISM